MPRPVPSPPACLLVAALLVAACGGSDGGSPSGGSPTPFPPSASNPCPAALAGLESPGPAAAARKSPGGPFGHDDRDPRELLVLHEAYGGRRVSTRAGAAAADRIGQIAVLPDDGGLVVPPNAFDLRGAGLVFEPNAEAGFDVRRVGGEFRADLGRRLGLADDDSSEEAFAFAFPFYGVARDSAFVNSDGNLTFGEPDTSTEERSLGRVLSGAPRIAPFFADLDPSSGGGVFVSAAADAFTVTWCAVPGFDSTDTVTAQASLLPGGAVEVMIDASTTLRSAVVAVSPGATAGFTAVDLGAAGPSAGGTGAVGERFAAEATLDLVAASRRFYASFPDAYDQLVFWTDTDVTESGTFAFETTVNNAITGIGQDLVELAQSFGSGGRLGSLVVMDDVAKYPSNPSARVVAAGENTTLSLLAHETGHRWGATLLFRDGSGEVSDLLLGRQRAHWSFFFDSDASVLEGNDIEDLGGGSFRTVATVQRYGPLDLYAMGLIGEDEVPSLFFVDGGSVPATPGIDRESGPRTGASVTGTRRDLTVGDVVAALGQRRPRASQSPRLHRQAWVYVVGPGRTASPDAVAKLEVFRERFESYFEVATGGRMSLDARLD